MRLLEYQAKCILAENGIPVPSSTLLRSPTIPPTLQFPAVLKAQVLTGGRGKAGGVRVAANVEQARLAAEALFALDIKGQPVRAVLAEEKIDLERELYLALLIDKQVRQPLIVASPRGGVDIEQVARESPQDIVKKHFDLALGPRDYVIRHLARCMDVQDTAGIGHLVQVMYNMLRELDATLVEINPLGQASRGLVALDAKVILDDKAAYRHCDRHSVLQAEQDRLLRAKRTASEQLAAELNITYVRLDGDIGIISDGAGTGMLILDLVHDLGGSPANFCELGGLGDAARMCQGIEVILADPRVRVLLITLIGGLTRMDDMAAGILRYLEIHHQIRVPAVVRMCGTCEAEGKAMLAPMGIHTYDDLLEAVQQAVTAGRH